MTSSDCKVRIWGARGTTPTAAHDRLRFRGNTSCVAVELPDGEHIILDCGSGLRLLGKALSTSGETRPRRFHIFLSHYHLDHIEGLDNRNGTQVVSAFVPLASMFGYVTDLRSVTQGRATSSMEFSHYAEVPQSIASELVQKSQV